MILLTLVISCVTLVTLVTFWVISCVTLVTLVIFCVTFVTSVTSWVTLVITSKPLTCWIVFEFDAPPIVWVSANSDASTLAFLIERVGSWVASTLPWE